MKLTDGLLFGLLLYPEDGGNTFLRNVGVPCLLPQKSYRNPKGYNHKYIYM
jgi:hypothetical protein